MGFASSSLLSMALLLVLCSTIQAVDVTKLLGQYPEFALFSKALTEAKLVDQVNALNAVTILALDDNAMASLAGKSPEAIKAILSTHILVGYYDERKLVEAIGSHTQIETLYQSSGVAQTNQGYIYVALINEGEIVFGSAAAAPSTVYDVGLVKTVTNEPEAVSFLEVTKPIVVPGLADNVFSDVKLPLAALAGNIAVSPSALAPAPSAASRVCMGVLGAASAFAAFFLAL